MIRMEPPVIRNPKEKTKVKGKINSKHKGPGSLVMGIAHKRPIAPHQRVRRVERAKQ